MDQNALRQEKQLYLREAIMEAGYDAEQFVHLMEIRRIDGGEIDNWSLQELKDMVEEFKEKEKKIPDEISDKSDVPASTGKPISTAEKEYLQIKAESVGKGNSVLSVYRMPLPDFAKTLPIDTNEMTNANLKPKIAEAKVVDAGIFKSKYVVFRIDTPAKGWSVERRFKEFLDLRGELVRLHPGCLVPPICCSKEDKETEPKTIANRKQVLQQFLDEVMAHPVLCCDDLVYYFLHYLDQGGKKVDDFTKRIKLYSLMATPKEIEDQKTPEGKARVTVNQEIIDFVSHLTSATAVLVPQFAELQKLNKIMNVQIDKLSETLVKQQQIYKELAAQFKSLGETQIGSSYESMYLVFAKINSSYLQIQKMIHEVFKPLNKQQLVEQVMIQERLNEIKTLKVVLAQSEKKLRDRKTLLFEQQDITKWELSPDCSESMESLFNNRVVAFREMLPRETKECTKIKLLSHSFIK